jgi:hypothetical protein
LADRQAKRTWAGDKILPHPAGRNEVDDGLLAAFGTSDALKETRPAIPTPMLDVIFKDGRIASFNYSYLRRVDFEPGDSLRLRFTDTTVVAIEGRNLRRMRDQIRLHRADEIQEGRENEEALKSDDEPHIASISIEVEEEFS